MVTSNMDNLEELGKTALKGLFNLFSTNEEYLKSRHIINNTVGNIEPETLAKFDRLHAKFEMEYRTFNQQNSKLIQYLKSTPTKSVTLNIKKGLPYEGNFTFELDPTNNLIVKRLQ